MMTEIDKWNEATNILKSNPKLSIDLARVIIPNQEHIIEEAKKQ
jgi:predicted membrane protein